MYLAYLGYPKLRELIEYLERCGFCRGEEIRGGHVLYRHPEVQCFIALLDRDPYTAARPTEMHSVYSELTNFGVVTERHFSMFWAKSVLGLPFDE